MKLCPFCQHKMEPEQKLCHFIVVGIKYLMHYLCAVEVKDRAGKELASF